MEGSGWDLLGRMVTDNPWVPVGRCVEYGTGKSILVEGELWQESGVAHRNRMVLIGTTQAFIGNRMIPKILWSDEALSYDKDTKTARISPNPSWVAAQARPSSVQLSASGSPIWALASPVSRLRPQTSYSPSYPSMDFLSPLVS